MCDMNLSVIPGFCVVECLELCFFRQTCVSNQTIFVLVGEIVQSPLAELVGIPYVLRIVNVDKRPAFFVLIKYAFQSVCCLLEELRPLSFEELVVFNFNSIEVKTFESSAD